MEPIITGRLGCRFRVKEEIGRGSFGVVYEATDDRGRKYAVKVIAPVADDSLRASFEQEIRSTEGLEHENILSPIDYGTCVFNGQEGLFVASELCTGGNYREMLEARANSPLALEGVIREFMQILSGLEVLHTKIIHRDLKPENILISNGMLKITDFGLAKFVDHATRTLTFKGLGSPLYMAPEVWRLERSTVSTDLYAIGVMLFEAVTGRPPFEGLDANELREHHLYTPSPRAREFNTALSPVMDGIIKRLLEKEISRRWQNAGEVIDALRNIGIQNSGSEAQGLVTHLRAFHDGVERRKASEAKEAARESDEIKRIRHMEAELLALMEDKVAVLNQQVPEEAIVRQDTATGHYYQLRDRSLEIRFFRQHELLSCSDEKWLQEELREKGVVHGGTIKVLVSGQARHGWNIVLFRKGQSTYGEWHLVETYSNPLSTRSAQFEPSATEVADFARNLAFHLRHTTDIVVLKVQPFDEQAVARILGALIHDS